MTSELFAKEIPHLLTEHLEHLKASAISIDVIKERGYKTAMGKTPLKEAGFSKSQQRATGILIPLHGVDGAITGYQYRPDNPRTNAKGRAVKYENPAGSTVHLDIPPRCQSQLGNPTVPLWFTEGVKKVDALASKGVCAVGLTGVWGFKGRNPLGGITILADFDYLALKERLVYILFDSDSDTNKQVGFALNRLNHHLTAKGAKVSILHLPHGAKGEKIGADDYLAQGHTIEDLIELEAMDSQAVMQTIVDKSADAYFILDGRICWNKQTQTGPVATPLCNFNAKVTEDVLKDNGQEQARFFKISGITAGGKSLPSIEVQASAFQSMGWIAGEWGMQTIIAAGQTVKDRLREAIQLQSQDAIQRQVFTHTGWREVDGEHVYLTSGGAVGIEGTEVELEPPLQRYLLIPPTDDPLACIKQSFDFLFLGELHVTLPLWTSMYLAPLSAFIDPAFTLWYVGASGSFKSVLVALALSHFGDFDYLHLPAAWRDTQNQLEKLLFLAKDIPLVIDDWAPGQDYAKARELEVKAEHIIRAQGNRQGRGRMKADTSLRVSYTPRGLLITTGEQLPSGHSHTSRIVTVEIEKEHIFRDLLTEAQSKRRLYNGAMYQYITWIGRNWNKIKSELPKQWESWREEVYQESQHARLPSDIASLYSGLYMASEFAVEMGTMTEKESEALRSTGWKIFIEMAKEQGDRVEEERPSKRFIEALRAMLDQGKVVLWSKDELLPKTPAPGQTAIGWTNGNGHLLLNPSAAYGAVFEYCQRSGNPFSFKQQAVWKDLKRQGISLCQDGRTQYRTNIYGKPTWVVQIKQF